MQGYAMDLSPDALALDLAAHRRDECETLATALLQRLREGSLPPDDAKAWTRVLVQELRDAKLIPPWVLM